MKKNNISITSGSDITLKIRDFIAKTFLIEFNGEINDATDLFNLGIIDSFGFIELITYIEKTFQVEFEQDELLADHLSTVNSMVELIRKKHNG
jgi:acyl carrier protein